MTDVPALEFYAHPSAMTSAGRYAATVDALPDGISDLVKIGQGLLLHEHWAAEHGQTLSDERRSEIHIRPLEAMFDRIFELDHAPLTVARPPEKRMIGNCRHFSVLLAGFLQAKRIPARARCGFGTYFEHGKFIDHWVCEVWCSETERWVMVDAQIDDLQRSKLGLDIDTLDLPSGRFLVAGEAWARCRADAADPDTFGILDVWGLWFVAGNLLRDLAALNKHEMLPWDSWGTMPRPDTEMTDELLLLFDRLAAVTQSPEIDVAAVHEIYRADERLRVPNKVINLLRQTAEHVPA